MRKLSSLFIAFGLLISLFSMNIGSSVADAANMVANGGFETGDLSAWTITGAKEKFKITKDHARTGNYALEITGPQTFAYISFPFHAVPGAKYTLSFYAKGSSNFVYRIANPAVKPAAFAKADSKNQESEWKSYSLDFTAPSDATELRLDFTDVQEGKIAYLDDISIVAVDGGGTAAAPAKPAPAAPATLTSEASSGGAGGADSADLLQTIGFETHGLADWKIKGASNKFNLTESTVRTGNYALEITGPQNYAYISQFIRVIPDTEYVVTFYARGSGDFVYRVADPAITPGMFAKGDSSNSESEWKLYTFTFMTPPDVNQLRLDFTDVPEGKVAYVDDIEIYGPSVFSNAKPFVDLKDHIDKNDVDMMVSLQIVDGVDETHFAPDQPVTRAEFASMLVKALALGIDVDLPDSKAYDKFKDVNASDKYAEDIASAIQMELISVFDDGTFRPNDTVSREEMAVMFHRAIILTETDMVYGSRAIFNDGDMISADAKLAVSDVAKARIMDVWEGNHFAPKDEVTRAKATVFLVKFLEYVDYLNM